MYKKYVFILLVCVELIVFTSTSRLLSRRKRYVSFPDGSSFSIAGCVTVGVIGQPAPSSAPGTFTFSVNWAIAYDLPNTTETVALYVKKFKHNKAVTQRRNRRDLYEKLEIILDKMGYNGRQCILKTLCETTQRIMPKGSNMIEEVFRTIFSMPVTQMLTSEPIEHALYSSAHRLGRLLEDCDALYSCPISLVDWAKGYYNAPSPTTDVSRTPWQLFSSSFS